MAYTDIISLNDAKTYLRVDDTLTEDDEFIIRTINAAFSWIEKRTNQIVSAREKEYVLINGYTRIYDSPINTDLSSLTDYKFTNKGLYYVVCANNLDVDNEFTLNIGERFSENVDFELINVAYEIIEYYYNQSKKKEDTKGMTVSDYLSEMSKEYININRRFIL